MGRRLDIEAASLCPRAKGKKKRKDERESGPPIAMLSERFTTAILAIVIVAMPGALILLIWKKSTTPVLTDYEGRSVERWADYAETSEGSRPRFNLHIEAEGGKRFTVRVNPTVYESAKIGMRVKSRNGQVVLIEPD